MKKNIFTLYIVLLSVLIVNAQDFKPMKSPGVTTFLNANYLPVNESTGKIDVKIPIYTIKLDGLSIPISLSYDTGGVKVDAPASSVGLNWTLNASGLISKEIIGTHDLKTKFIKNDIVPSPPGYVYTKYGYLSHLFEVSNIPVIEGFRDGRPDLFYVMAPGLSTKFTHKKNGEAFEISNNVNKIESAFSKLSSPYNKESNKYNFKFKIKSNKGFVYSFKERETYQSFQISRSQNSTKYPLTDNLIFPVWSENLTDKQAEELFNNFRKHPYFIEDDTEDLGLVHLSSIKSPMSKKRVEYFYENTFIVDNNRRIERTLDKFNVVSQVNYEHDFSKTKTLKKIVFPQGVIDFYYDSNRLDVRGGKILKKIEIRNNQGNFIKGVVFEHDYFNSIENCSNNYCYRLRLNSVKFLDKDKKVMPGYSFEYNTGKLPKRFSVDQDFMGYYNGTSSINEKQYFPKSYYKAGQGKKSIIPFPFTGYTMLPGGNASKVPNINYTKAASLSKITYPTGGVTKFNFELNTFNFQGTTVNSGGLRLKSQELYNKQILQKKILYEYTLENGKSSGSITNLPLFMGAKTDNFGYKPVTKQVSNTKLELTNGAYVTYSRVKSREVNNGYTINTYTNAVDYPNFTPSTYSLHGNTSNTNWLNDAIGKGYLLDIYRDYSVKRSRLLTSKVYNENNVLITSKENEYKYFEYNSFNIDQRIITFYPNLAYSTGTNTGFAKFTSVLPSESFNLKKTTQKKYSSQGVIKSEKQYIYDVNRPFVKESLNIIGDGEIIKEKSLYPFDLEVLSNPNVLKLKELNILTPVKTFVYENNTLLATSETILEDFGNDKILPKATKSSRGIAPLKVKKEFHNYDIRGNLTEYSDNYGTHVTVLWGYRYQHKIAEIIGANLSEVLVALNINNLDVLQNLSNNELKIKLNSLRAALPNAQVYSYIHTPLEGTNEITSPNGKTKYFSYDTFHRLNLVKDKDNNIVSRNTYNYKLSPTAENIHEENLQLEIKKRPTDFYTSKQSATNHKTVVAAFVKGGKGNYKYQWSLVGTTTVLADEYDYVVDIPCGESRNLQVKVTDDNNTQITKTITVYAAHCNEPFFVGEIQGASTTNNQNNFWVDIPQGGSYDIFSYQWYIPNNTSGVGAPLKYDDPVYPKSAGLLTNTSGRPVTVNLSVKVTDIESGYFVIRSKSVVIQPEFEINSCFVAGTKITLADGKQKLIEEVSVGDKVLTYNIKTQKTEVGVINNLVSPIHTNLVVFTFEKNITNTNTLDHPYYVKGKGWASYNPEMTKIKYGLNVKKIEIGDFVLLYNSNKKKVEEIKLVSQKLFSETQKTYNLDKVSKNHNFFANGILVHNKSSY
ncbi:hypothetical protein [Tenacibaculum halocynthiae]|uniref:hypothetical protein n=1 Tax=Tenacibaculum halocynthiae TaxID=1254437 RepID=UPI003893A3C2